MRITFVTRKFGNVERNSHCDVLHITPVRVARLVLDCNGVFAIKAYSDRFYASVKCRTRNQVSPGSNLTLLPFRRLGSFVLSIDALVHSAV